MRRVTGQRQRVLSILAALSVFCSVFVSLPIAFAQQIGVTDPGKSNVRVIGFEEIAVVNSHAARGDVKLQRAQVSLPPRLTFGTPLLVVATVNRTDLLRLPYRRTSQTFGRAPPRIQ